MQRYFPPGTAVTRPAGGFVVWVEMSPGGRACDAMDLYEAAAARKINVAPGPIFSAKGHFRRHVRLNCSAKWSDELDRAIRTLGELCSDEA